MPHKKQLSCRHAIFCVRQVIEKYVANGSTVNVCALDLSKAFDKMNHYVLLVKLMDRELPTELLQIFEYWFLVSVTCIKWNQHTSEFFNLRAGVRQGGVLSPVLFSVFIDGLVDKIKSANVGCYTSTVCLSVFLYADDILLIAPSVTALQTLLSVCEQELDSIDMCLNVAKSVCIRFGPRFDVVCSNLVSISGTMLKWSKSCRYLGAYFISGRLFRCCFDNAKARFFRAFNAVYGKVGRFASEDVILNLLRAKCLPSLLYATEACPMSSRDKGSLEFSVTRIFMKILRTTSSALVQEAQAYFGFLPLKSQLDIRTAKFLEKFLVSQNSICLLFEMPTKSLLTNIFVKYSSTICSANSLKSYIEKLFLY